MELNEIKEFLRNKPGYLKEGKKRLRDILRKQGFATTLYTCAQALREVNAELSVKPSLKKEPKILFYDIETAYGLARVWRPGWKVKVSYRDFVEHPKIICISWKWNNSDEVHTVYWDKNKNDKKLLETFIPELNKADFIVAHNGDKFDLPWIRARALANNIPMYPRYTAVDTYKVARNTFKFPANRLDDIGDYLGLGRKLNAPYELWTKVIDENCRETLDEMIKYCEQDVFLLEAVYNKLSEFTLPTLHNGTLNGETKQTSPYTGTTNIEHIKTTTTKAGTKKHTMLCKDTNRYFEMSNTDYNKFKLINQ